MLRHNVPVRRDLDQIAADNGFDFHIIDNEIYWDESRAYRFTLRQIEEQIEKPTAELHQMCLEVVDRAVKDEEILTQLAIPPLYWDVIAESWRARDPSLYGRMDFAWCGNAPVKLLEYNADTPTSLYESAYFQWLWLEDARRSGIIPRDADRPDAEMLQTMLLRSMKQAIYDPENRGHFGLALQSYAHFTSPIRRYPDLTLHRAIKYLLAKEQGHQGNTTETGGYHYSMEEMLQLGQHCSMAERRADEATRDVADWLKCDFMLDQVGNVFKGVISSVTGFGFFVRLDDLFIDGLVHVSSLDNDYYRFDQVGQRLMGESSGQTYRLGDRVEVRVEAVNMDERKIDFSLISSERAPRNVGKTAREKAKKGDAGKKGGKRRQVGKKVNFEPDSAFRGEKKTKPKAAKKDARKAKKPSAKTQKIAAATKAKRAAKKKVAE
jgi:predicted RNA-binding protein with RPS1 domain